MAKQETEDANALVCSTCGYLNRQRIRFCAMCGVGVDGDAPGTGASPASQALMHAPKAFAAGSMPPQSRGMGHESHHYHHHYQHHYFPGGQEGTFSRAGADPAREEKMRPNLALRGDMSRAEAAVRRVTQEWVLACNTKHLDDLLELYGPDPMVLRSNCAPIRGMAAVREFFFGALDSGLGEVEMEPLRVEIVGDLAYQAGRCKALVPGAIGKRREERAKYLWVCHRQGNGEWKLVADCWSSDLTLSTLESDVPPGAGVKSNPPRKG